MPEVSEKHIENLQKAIKNIRIADHMIYVTYPVIKDKRLLLKALDGVYDSIVCIINAILQYDFLYKRISLTNDPKQNFDIFLNKCAKRYNLSEDEVNDIIELLTLIENHKKSSMEFLRKDKIVIMSESLKTTVVDSERLKKYLNLSKNLVNKAKFSMGIQI
jgi:hypothetical protein